MKLYNCSFIKITTSILPAIYSQILISTLLNGSKLGLLAFKRIEILKHLDYKKYLKMYIDIKQAHCNLAPWKLNISYCKHWNIQSDMYICEILRLTLAFEFQDHSSFCCNSCKVASNDCKFASAGSKQPGSSHFLSLLAGRQMDSCYISN